MRNRTKPRIDPVKRLTYFVVVTFREVKGTRGKLTADEPHEARNREHALYLVERYKPLRVGVIAFYRTGDAASDDWEDAVIIARHGRVPGEIDDFVDESAAELDSWALSSHDLKIA